MRGLVWALVVASCAGVAVVAVSPAGATYRDADLIACASGLTTSFTDIGGTTHESAIACAVPYDLVGGTTSTTYDPTGIVSRGQMATFVIRTLGLSELRRADVPSAGFVDTAGSPHELTIDAVVALGIATGTSASTFSPSAPVSRAQTATFLLDTAIALGYVPPGSVGDCFSDVDGSPHETAINVLCGEGVAGGTSSGNFSPDGPVRYGTYSPGDPVTRGALASFLVRLVDLGIERGFFAPFITDVAVAALMGGEVVPGPGDLDGLGTAIVMTTDVPHVLCIDFEVTGTDEPWSISVHVGSRGQAGDHVAHAPQRLRSQPPPFERCFPSDAAEAILDDPDAYYVEVLTGATRDSRSAVRGQLGSPTTFFGGDLDGSQVVPGPGHPDAVGLTLGFTTSQPNVLCLSTLVLAPDAPTSVHLHEGGLQTSGPEVLSFAPLNALGHPLLCRTTPRAADVAGNPAGFYVDVHTSSHPDGALRDQLEADSGKPRASALGTAAKRSD